MVKSMTAYAHCEKEVMPADLNHPEKVNISWEMRSVNHRYLDVSLNLPDKLNAYENSFKEQVRNKLGRGKIDIKLEVSSLDSETADEIPLNKEKIRALLSARHMLEAISKKPVTLSGMDILNWPGVLEAKTTNSDAYLDEIQTLLNTTLDEMIANREAEGLRLATMIKARCAQVIDLVKAVQKRRPLVIQALRDRMLKKLEEIDVSADPNRLEQEMVFQAQRLDVDEELDRINSHIAEVTDVLARDEPIGRRLDFLMQELHREANTLAAKSNDSDTTKAAVELKVLIEQMREQVMNIE